MVTLSSGDDKLLGTRHSSYIARRRGEEEKRRTAHRALSMYKGDAGGAEFQDHEVATSGGIAGYHRGIRQTLGSLEAEHTRVVPKAQ